MAVAKFQIQAAGAVLCLAAVVLTPGCNQNEGEKAMEHRDTGSDMGGQGSTKGGISSKDRIGSEKGESGTGAQ
jgi:hypothetical protein